jgi:hypothetical protein
MLLKTIIDMVKCLYKDKLIWLITIIVIGCTTACDDMADPSDQNLYIEPISARLFGKIDGNSIDSIMVTCKESLLVNHHNGLTIIAGERFIFRQGMSFTISEDISITLWIYIFDQNYVPEQFNPEVYKQYIDGEEDNRFLYIELEKDGKSFSNRWIDNWSEVKYLKNSNSVDTNELYDLFTYQLPEGLPCGDNGSALSVTIGYNGMLTSEDSRDSLKLELEKSEVYLIPVI